MIDYLKITILIFTSFILIACTVDSTQKINSKKNLGQNSKVNVTFEGSIDNGIYSNSN